GGRRPVVGEGGRVAEAERPHVGHAERPGAQARDVGPARRACGLDVAERVGSLVAEARCIRRAADAEGIEHEEKGARHRQFLRFGPVSPVGAAPCGSGRCRDRRAEEGWQFRNQSRRQWRHRNPGGAFGMAAARRRTCMAAAAAALLCCAPAAAQEAFRIGLVASPGEEAGIEGLAEIKAAYAAALGQPVEVMVARDYAALADAHIEGRIDYAVYSAPAFAAAERRCLCLRPVAAPVDAGGATGLRSVLIVRTGGPGAAGRLAVGPADSLTMR